MRLYFVSFFFIAFIMLLIKPYSHEKDNDDRRSV